VASDGVVWREETYASLSTIARLVTGTNWNGPKFFGLRIGSGKADKSEAALRSPSRPRKERPR
jgi:Protein of unknown function (DUF2924)